MSNSSGRKRASFPVAGLSIALPAMNFVSSFLYQKSFAANKSGSKVLYCVGRKHVSDLIAYRFIFIVNGAWFLFRTFVYAKSAAQEQRITVGRHHDVDEGDLF